MLQMIKLVSENRMTKGKLSLKKRLKHPPAQGDPLHKHHFRRNVVFITVSIICSHYIAESPYPLQKDY